MRNLPWCCYVLKLRSRDPQQIYVGICQDPNGEPFRRIHEHITDRFQAASATWQFGVESLVWFQPCHHETFAHHLEQHWGNELCYIFIPWYVNNGVRRWA